MSDAQSSDRRDFLLAAGLGALAFAPGDVKAQTLPAELSIRAQRNAARVTIIG